MSVDEFDPAIERLFARAPSFPDSAQFEAALAAKLGESLGGGFHALPSWQAIASADDDTLRVCSLGYRAAYLRGTAKKLLARPRWAEEFGALPTPALLAELRSLPGVGPKVAVRIVTELRNKAPAFAGEASASIGLKQELGEGVASAPVSDAVSALTNLGYSRDQAANAVAAALKRVTERQGAPEDLLAAGAPLATLNPATLYGGGATGYIDYPALADSSVQ